MIIEAQGIKKAYQHEDRLFMAVDDVSLSIGEGEFVCIEGRSGSGKSTLLNIMAGLLAPTAGSVAFEGREYGGMDDSGLSELRRTRLGYIMQGYGVLPNFTVLQNVLLPYVLSGRGGGLAESALAILEQAGIRQLAQRYPSGLSGGELRRVAIARALLMSPRLLIADEPTGDLDEETASGIMGLFAAAAKNGTAILMVTHDKDAAGYADRIHTMKAGRLVPDAGSGQA
ncbi:MAG: ABC transporter ATP-binding protein [Clostridiales Family XIII bacterium]|jgi:putative ABC transport system ATP-binding protein|nr:ABC transporter ATP-binding protein [Clostridiales Family XIII bacterium]